MFRHRLHVLQIMVLLFPMVTTGLSAQHRPDQFITRDFVEANIRFLSHDLLEGRKTGARGNATAALYIAESFRSMGVRPLPVLNDYNQEIGFSEISPASKIDLNIGDVAVAAENVVVMQGVDIDFRGDVIYAKQAWGSDLDGLDIAGKYVLAYLGSPDVQSAQDAFGISPQKIEALKEKKALGLIEIYNGRIPWTYVKRFMESPRMRIEEVGETSLPHIIVNHDLKKTIEMMEQEGVSQLALVSDGVDRHTVISSNVVGLIEGVDPELKDECIVLSAHYDHIGMGKATEDGDSIYNGARDNAIGCAALLSAVKYMSVNKPRRSVICVAFTGEEMGLLGSQYFVDHPVVPLEQMVFNLNSDGAGYSDTSIISIMGMGRISVADILEEAIVSVGLTAFADPAPEQNLFDRSDNVSFAKKGIPAPTFTPGFKEFDDKIMGTYHQMSDEAEGLSYSYLRKYCEAFAKAALMVADADERPKWKEGDKYESVFKMLYEK